MHVLYVYKEKLTRELSGYNEITKSLNVIVLNYSFIYQASILH